MINNGEIYNHHAIRQQLTDYPFQIHSDSEVILALHQKYGKHAVDHLDGMFAFALYDRKTDSLFMVRDPLGIKPLYYGWHDDTLFFASEIKTLQHTVDDVQEFPPGHIYADSKFEAYYDLADLKIGTPQASEPTLQDIRQSLTQAVQKRLMSDVPLGVYLSGGLDSTIIAALIAESNPDLHSFAVGLEGSHDLEHARQAARDLETQHHEYIYTSAEIMEVLPQIIYYLESFDPSLVRSAIPNYFLARMTREYVTVVLTGEGAHELYAGYHYLKQLNDDVLHVELIALTGSLYNCNLQRCDRMTMAHSIEARVPFLDIDFVELSMQVPKEQKIHPQSHVEKWVLRRAFEDILPSNVTWRRKEQFSQGAGSNQIMEAIAENRFSDEFAMASSMVLDRSGTEIDSIEMLLYYMEFDRQFTDTARSLVSLWRGHSIL